MCTISVVMDHYEPLFPELEQFNPGTTKITVSPEMLRGLIGDFKEAVEAAKTVDRLTNQPDCIDPKKATLLERVDALEKRLDALEKLVGK